MELDLVVLKTSTEALISGASAIVATKTFEGAIDAARKFVADKFGKREAREVGVKFWGLVLFELRSNIVGLASMAEPNHYALISLQSWDSLFDKLCTLTPVPAMIASVQEFNTVLREIQSLLRVAVDAAPIVEDFGSLGGASTEERGGGHQWRDARLQAADLLKRAPQFFNALRSIVADAGQDVHGRDWQKIEAVMVPDELPVAS
jgi:hypothetical protein